MQPRKKQMVVYVVDVVAISGEYMADLPFPDRCVSALCVVLCVCSCVRYVHACLCTCMCVYVYVYSV